MNLSWWKQRISWYFLQACWQQRVFPWNYWFVNLEHIDPKFGFFSKFAINEQVPKRWRLQTRLLPVGFDLEATVQSIGKDFSFPLYLKPEWSQSSFGVYRIQNISTLRQVLKKIRTQRTPFICQTAAAGQYEYDLFLLTNDTDTSKPQLLTCTQCIPLAVEGDGQSSVAELIKNQLPQFKQSVAWLSDSTPTKILGKGKRLQVSFINGTNNGTRYQDLTTKLSAADIKRIYQHLKQIGHFSMTRISVMADTPEAIVDGDFKVIEINLLSPFPLNFLDQSWSPEECKRQMKIFGTDLVTSIKYKSVTTQHRFWKLIRLHWKSYRRFYLSRT